MKNLKTIKKQQGALIAVEYAMLLCVIVAGYVALTPALSSVWDGINTLFSKVGDGLSNFANGGGGGHSGGFPER